MPVHASYTVAHPRTPLFLLFTQLPSTPRYSWERSPPSNISLGTMYWVMSSSRHRRCPGGYLLLEAPAGMGQLRLTEALESSHQCHHALGDMPLHPILRVRITPGGVSVLNHVCRELFDTLTNDRGNLTSKIRNACRALPSSPPNLNQDPAHIRSAISQPRQKWRNREGSRESGRRPERVP